MALLEKLLELNASMKYMDTQSREEAFEEIITKISGKDLKELNASIEKEIRLHLKELKTTNRHETFLNGWADNIIYVVWFVVLLPVIFLHIFPMFFFELISFDFEKRPYILLITPILSMVSVLLSGSVVISISRHKRVFNYSHFADLKVFFKSHFADAKKVRFWIILFGPSLLWMLIYIFFAN